MTDSSIRISSEEQPLLNVERQSVAHLFTPTLSFHVYRNHHLTHGRPRLGLRRGQSVCITRVFSHPIIEWVTLYLIVVVVCLCQSLGHGSITTAGAVSEAGVLTNCTKKNVVQKILRFTIAKFLLEVWSLFKINNELVLRIQEPLA